jgi:hypothetical protein
VVVGNRERGSEDHRRRVAEFRRYLLLAFGTLLAVYGLSFSFTQKLRETQVDGCARGNVIRLSQFRANAAEADLLNGLALSVRDETIAGLLKDYSGSKTSANELLVHGAEETGAPSAPGAVTLDCNKLIPPVYPFPFS